MTSSNALARLRYQWATGTGGWASARQLWASAPGRRFQDRVLTSDNGQLTIGYQGFPEGLAYVLAYLRDQQTAVAGPVSALDRPPVRWRQIVRSAEAPEPDLLVIGCSRRRASRLPRPASVVLPFRLHQLVDIVVGDAEATLKTVSPNERRQFANLHRKQEWTAEIGAEFADFEFLYERMHLPTMASRHGDEARTLDRELALRALSERGFVLFVNEGGKRVAGVICVPEDGGETLRMRLLGVLDGDPTHYRSGAVKAVYYLTIEWAAGNGCKRVDFHGGDPFPGKGVFQFKRRFHPTLVHAEDHISNRRAYLRVVRDTPAVRDFLVATPMFTVDDADRLIATHFADSSRPPMTRIRADCDGIFASQTVDLDAFIAGLPAADPAPAVTADRLVDR